MSRFDYVKYDERTQKRQVMFKTAFEAMCSMVESLPTGRAQSLAITALEESYMWVGKALRDDQISRNDHVTLQEERKNG